MAKKVFGSFLVMLFSILIFLYFRTGAYKSVKTVKAPAPMLELYYMENVGPYHKIVDSLNYVEDEFNKLGIECPRTFAHFMSDPEIIEHEKLISHVGCAFSPKEAPQIFTLPKKVEQKFYLDTKNAPDILCYKGSFEGSPSLSALKVYPRLKEMAQEDRVKITSDYIELYTVDGDRVLTETYLCQEP